MKKKESNKVEFKESTAELKKALEGICAFANQGEGILYFGIDDKGKVIGQDISDKTIQKVSTTILSSIEPRVYPNIYTESIDGKEVLVIDIKNGPDSPYFYKGKSYKRVGTSNAYLSRYEVEKSLYERDNPKYRYEKTVITEYKGSIDRKTLNWFLKKAEEVRSLPIDNKDKQKDILQKLNLLTDGKINIAGLVCFGKEIQRYLPESLVKCAVFDGVEKRSDCILEHEDFRTNIFEQIEGVQKFIQKHCRKRYAVNPETARREPVYEWPLLAIREALANAIAHRDYMISGHTDIAIFDDRIEIWSSGTLPDGITLTQLNKTHKSVLRNPAIAEMLYFAGYIERWGSGISAMNTLVKKAGLPKPIYAEIGSNFVVTFKKEDQVGTKLGLSWDQVAGEVAGEVVGEVAGEVVQLLKNLKVSLTRKEMQEKLKLKGQANFRDRYLQPALNQGFIEMTQPDSPKSPTQKYRITDKGKQLLKRKN